MAFDARYRMGRVSDSANAIKDKVGRFGNMARGFDRGLMQSSMGRAFRQGIAESAGFYYQGGFAMQGKSMGFLGLRGNLVESAVGKDFTAGYRNVRNLGGGVGKGVSSGAQWARSGLAARGVGAKAVGIGAAKFAGKTALASLGPLFVAMSIHQGYKEGGVLGAIASGGEAALYGAGFNMAATALGGAASVLAPLAAVAAIGVGGYMAGEAAQAKEKGLKRMELGGVAIDALGSAGAATMRQRSMMALQNTHINGRMALGQEATIMHTPFR